MENQHTKCSSPPHVEKNIPIDQKRVESCSTPNSKKNAVINHSVTLFQTFANDINPKDLSKLRSMSSNKREDSTFVLNAVRFLYNNDVGKLASLSLTGRSREMESKSKMTPEKKTKIETLFVERLSSFDLDPAEMSARSSKFKVHIKNAFVTIKRSTKTDTVHAEKGN